jgi:hypothetical protein
MDREVVWIWIILKEQFAELLGRTEMNLNRQHLQPWISKWFLISFRKFEVHFQHLQQFHTRPCKQICRECLKINPRSLLSTSFPIYFSLSSSALRSSVADTIITWTKNYKNRHGGEHPIARFEIETYRVWSKSLNHYINIFGEIIWHLHVWLYAWNMSGHPVL